MKLIPGAHYYAGLDLPFFVTQSMASRKLVEAGFVSPRWHEPSEAPPINPRIDPTFREGYPEWVDGVYQGPAKEVDVPITPHWLLVVPPSGEPAPLAMTQTSEPGALVKSDEASVSPALIIAAGVTLDLLFFGFVFKKLTSRRKDGKKGSLMSPLLLGALGLGAVAVLASRKSQPNWSKPTRAEIDARYVAAMNMPTADPAIWQREIAYFTQLGELGLANNLTLKFQDVKKQYAAMTK